MDIIFSFEHVPKPWGRGVHQPKRTIIGCFLFIGKKIYRNFGSTIAYLNCETCDYI